MSRCFVVQQSQILGALMMREMATRYGRRGLGFLWVVGEPLIFCFGVIIMWLLIRQHNQHGVGVAPFVMSGYMCLLLLRHCISFSISAVESNIGLLYHRALGPLHFHIARCVLELAGSTAAFIVVYIVLFAFRQVGSPNDWLLMYTGWILMWLMAVGTGFILSGLASRFEIMERIVPVLTYAMIPLSGVFFMVDWLPEHVRDLYLLVPFPNAVEMIRGGIFGEFVATHYNIYYAVCSSVIMIVLGLLLIKSAEGRIEVD
ncbi:Polysialic acid transport protein KpsM [compost metagenome]